MAALDKGTASHILAIPDEPFESIAFGAYDLTPLGEGTHPVADMGDGIWGIPRGVDWPGVDIFFGPEVVPTSASWALIFATTGPLDTSDYSLDVRGWGGQLNFSNTGYFSISIGSYYYEPSSPISFTTPLDEGVTVWAIVSQPGARYVANSRDGVIRTTSAGGGSGGDLSIWTRYDIESFLLGSWFWDNQVISQADILATLTATAAEFADIVIPSPPAGLTGDGSWGISGAGELSDASIYDDPIIVAPPRGGSKTPPAVPTYTVPDGVNAPYLRHVYEDMPVPSLDGRQWPIDWTPTATDGAEYARFQTVVEGVDVSFLDGIAIPVPSYSRVEPFGSQSARILLPQLHAFRTMPTWAKPGANVDIRLILKAGGHVTLFSGQVRELARQEDTGTLSLECVGVMFDADLQLVPPVFTTAPQDVGARIASILNAVVSRRFGTVASVVTGCATSVAGGWESVLTGSVQRLLATCVSGGRQWTVKCDVRQPVIVKKNTTTIAGTFRTGQRGIDIDLSLDTSSAVNTIYGEGTNPDGGRWRNAKYPNWKPDDTPAYPNADPGDTMYVGRTDASTDSGSGVSDFQRKTGLTPTGTYSQADRTVIKRKQRRAGITVDGIVGPQTWAMLFDTGANTGTLDGAFIAPLAAAEEVMPRLYGPDGDDLGPNPDYDEDVTPVWEKRDYGQGVTKATGIQDAINEVARTSVPGWQGTITLTLDPVEMSRFEILEGQNWEVLDWQGDDVTVHVAAVDANPESGNVTLTVDELARDYPTLDAIRTADRAATDPAKAAVKRLLRGTVATDRPTYDAESPAGRMPKHAIFSNLWDVRRIPMGAFGTVNRTEFKTTSSPRAFSLAVFGKPITAADLLAIVGNPLTATEEPWGKFGDELDAAGFLNSWGWKEQPAGYSPGQYSNPNGKEMSPVTGRLEVDSSWDYASDQSPWIWVATIASDSCYVEGRFYGSPEW